MSSQADIKRQNPQSVELMVASDKRFLARPEFRIQLGDLIGEEARKLERTLNGPDFALIGAFSNDLIMQRVARAESATESVARIVGVLGRWGTGSELRLVLDLRIEFGVRESIGGLVALINLRTYPAVLLLYAYGLALLAARRYTDLLKFLSVTIVTERDNTTTVVSHLFLTSCAGGENNAWKFLPGLEKRKTPSAIICTTSSNPGPATICFRRMVTPLFSKIASCSVPWRISRSGPAKRTCSKQPAAPQAEALPGVRWDGSHGTGRRAGASWKDGRVRKRPMN
ncbi:hypothetical protein HAP48_0026790 [Bradyrhizobium septentrionale]|uniref:Uncharacterized protein n=1 Tax=Bradyrhizobium septentrionale TaxID=1404411 RepID=A0A973ZZV1_9BRAD|nr:MULTISPECIES: hypothetical protein [Bradyrhizobium]UGY12303.1 hypothetical protein HAP48_0026790 [Bradyrhizobium septentrionale]UGY25585.1 hypothetical protein HU675_0001380 [Bradyrhizobium septentrionale]